ncbi:hypothetical protein AGABI1DRAFT_114498 [Agaricus bisporus var. burnettii JB137-S8]|uniref:Glutamine amidotransferase domain-containing protein n=2 Tax=Agaricus bisporus var. burnettii TaxID=192524 RepID=K5WU50_AGABU|nr:uncharacterized protein AGABI1DRAFT_114498 [Agaricus bisporus var. burnettii JB137-S8]EKM78971.1 hypothetical protein AGABI1DRAFT_114498 [Agaricus bisporus var. burnettii JB137-S8]KAF7771805.1 hypothetical protein Agabi119p4_6116 [Agaricus bisporus var. burnettii]
MSVVPTPVNLALLICDELPPEFNHGTTTEIYDRWLSGAYPQGVLPRLNLMPYDVHERQEYPTAEELETIDAVMLTGSREDAFGEDAWITRLLEYTRFIHTKHPRIRMFGICFGLQIIARALGGTVERNAKWEYGLTAINVTHMGKEIFGVERLYELQQIHQDHVPLPSLSNHFSTGSIYLLGSSIRTPNQSFVQLYERCKECELRGKCHDIHQHIRILTFQGHPEFTDSIVTGLVRKWVKSGRIEEHDARVYYGKENTPAHLMDKSDPEPIWPYEYDGINVVGRAFWKVFGVKYDDVTEMDKSDGSADAGAV